MNAIDIFLTVLLNALPIVFLIIPYIFLRYKTIGKLYFRIMVGIILFYIIYWIIPLLFQFRLGFDELGISSGEEGLTLFYLPVHFTSLISTFSSYPLFTLPFIFFVAPLISLIIVWNRLRSEEGSISESLEQITYEYSESPLESIKKELKKTDWKREKDIMKLMIVYLPISLYILQIVLKVTGLQSFSLGTAETALGWFMEILFVYLAMFIFSIELLYSSKIAIKGRYFGEKVREETFRSLYLVGAPISLISLLLFSLEYIDSLDVIFFFGAYFFMATVIFVLFLDIFEPISILILIKVINWWKNRKKSPKKLNLSNIYYGLAFGFISVAVSFVINAILSFLIYAPIYGEEYYNILLARGLFNYNDPTLVEAIGFDSLIILNTISTAVIPLIIMILLLLYAFRYGKNITLGLTGFLIVVVIFSILSPFLQMNPLINFSLDEYWLAGRVSLIDLFGIDFYTMRTASFEANLSGVLSVLSLPYVFSRGVINVIIWALFVYYFRKSFKIKNIPIDERLLKKVIYTDVGFFISYDEYIQEEKGFLVSKNEGVVVEGAEQERQEVQELLSKLEQDRLIKALRPEEDMEIKRFYFTLKYLYNNNQIEIWNPEFSHTFERVKKQGLYIIFEDGRGVYDYEFSDKALQDPGLISGMFSAISSFIKETTKSTEVLKTIDHGDITILIEYGDLIFGALFIKGNQSAEIRSQLREFVDTFEGSYSEVLRDWTGALAPFKNTDDVVEKIFKEE
ncbi:MAG: hypothetical protein GF317_21005 [Candidatus Lokiarchaeota archaeon]|nr:hypothetical protein [Candidatus Lokiarchaeota archaeon]MBD3201924.1 hypothetical protein [Candidatus Lokiarchaeota archaeon]